MLSITPAVWRQLAAAFTCNLAAVTTGCMVGWSAPTLKKLREPNSPVQLTNYQEAWVVSALYYGTILSPFPSGFIMNKLGRKTSILVLSIFSILSWILVYFSQSAPMLIVARFLAGFWLGGTQTVVPIYTAEVTEPHVRGTFGTFYQINSYFGSNFIYVVAPYVSIQTMAVICGLMPLVFLILFSLCPESPYSYVMWKKKEAAAKSLSWLRAGQPIQAELEIIKTSVEKETEDDGKKIGALFTVPANRKAFITVEIMNIMQRLSGISCLKAFSSSILPQHLGPLTSDHCTMIIGFAWMFSSFICMGFIDKAGRKPLLYISSLGIGISMLWTGVWYFFEEKKIADVSFLNWLPLAGFLVFGCTFSVGLGPIAKVYQGEMFPSNLKGQASALTAMIAAFSSSVSTGLFPVLDENIGIYMNFFMFSAAGFLNLLFTYFYVIETKGKSLQTIQAELRGEKTESLENNGVSVKGDIPT